MVLATPIIVETPEAIELDPIIASTRAPTNRSWEQIVASYIFTREGSNRNKLYGLNRSILFLLRECWFRGG